MYVLCNSLQQCICTVRHAYVVLNAMSLFFPEQQLIQSPLHVNTTLTTVGKIVESRDFSKKSTLEPKPQTHPSTSAIEPSTVFEGWHKSWEETIPTNGIITPNIRWIKHNIEHGLFLPLKPLKNKYSEIVERKLLKNRMEFNPSTFVKEVFALTESMAQFTTKYKGK